jgi:hypothetical protein
MNKAKGDSECVQFETVASIERSNNAETSDLDIAETRAVVTTKGKKSFIPPEFCCFLTCSDTSR